MTTSLVLGVSGAMESPERQQRSNPLLTALRGEGVYARGPVRHLEGLVAVVLEPVHGGDRPEVRTAVRTFRTWDRPRRLTAGPAP